MGPPPTNQSYLNMDAIMEAINLTGAQAVRKHDIKMHILLTVLHTFLMELEGRNCLNIKTSYPWRSFPLLLSLLKCLNK